MLTISTIKLCWVCNYEHFSSPTNLQFNSNCIRTTTTKKIGLMPFWECIVDRGLRSVICIVNETDLHATKKVQSQFDMWICNSSQNMAIQSACKAIKLYRSINIYKSQAFIKVRWLFICYYYYICDGAWIVLIRWVILKAKQCRFLPSMALFMWSRFLIIDIKKLFGGALCNESDNFVIISSIKKVQINF